MGITAINGIAITASAASRVPVTDTTTGVGPYYLTFVDATSGYEDVRVDSSTLTYNATTNALTAASFVGSLAGTASWATNSLTSSLSNTIFVSQNTANNTQNYIPYGLASGGGPTATTQQFSQSGVLRFIPSTSEFRSGFMNNTSNGTKTNTADANLTIDAALTQSVTWIASLTATRSLIINNLEDGRQVNVYIRNTNATQRQIIFSGSATTAGHVLMNMSIGAGIASSTIQAIAATNGTMLVHAFNIGGNLVGGVS
jgi:hypothetical protein